MENHVPVSEHLVELLLRNVPAPTLQRQVGDVDAAIYQILNGGTTLDQPFDSRPILLQHL